MVQSPLLSAGDRGGVGDSRFQRGDPSARCMVLAFDDGQVAVRDRSGVDTDVGGTVQKVSGGCVVTIDRPVASVAVTAASRDRCDTPSVTHTRDRVCASIGSAFHSRTFQCFGRVSAN